MAPVLARYIEAGAKGLGEHKCGGAIDDPNNLNVFRACSELAATRRAPLSPAARSTG